MTWDYANPYTLAVSPQQADIDGLNHTNNAVYVQWCERIGWAHSVALGMDLAAWQALDRAWVIRHAEYDYTLPTLRGEALTLGTWLTQCDGKLTMERRFQLVRDADALRRFMTGDMTMFNASQFNKLGGIRALAEFDERHHGDGLLGGCRVGAHGNSICGRMTRPRRVLAGGGDRVEGRGRECPEPRPSTHTLCIEARSVRGSRPS